MEGFFVTGTGTEVGKTVVASWIAHGLSQAGRRVAVFKPAVTGLANGGEADHEMLRRAAGSRQGDDEIAPYRYDPPVSPHLAASMAGREIAPSRLLRTAGEAASGADALVAEGVGGLLVPITPAYTVRDLAVELGLPLVIASPASLGSINHTLLTIEAARSAGLEIASVVLTPWPDSPGRIEHSNRETIAELGQVAVLTLPRLALDNLASWPGLPASLDLT